MLYGASFDMVLKKMRKPWQFLVHVEYSKAGKQY